MCATAATPRKSRGIIIPSNYHNVLDIDSSLRLLRYLYVQCLLTLAPCLPCSLSHDGRTVGSNGISHTLILTPSLALTLVTQLRHCNSVQDLRSISIWEWSWPFVHISYVAFPCMEPSLAFSVQSPWSRLTVCLFCTICWFTKAFCQQGFGETAVQPR